MRILCALVVLTGLATSAAAQLDINPDQRLLEHSGDQAATPFGTKLDQLAFRDVAGQTHRLNQTTAFVFLSTSCPLAKRYTQRLNRLHDEFSESKIALFGVFSNLEDDRAEVSEHAEKMKFVFPVVKDAHGYLAGRLGAAMTPQAVLLNDRGVICYRGAIDDNRYENRVKEHYLHDALAALRDGQEIKTPETKTLGCSIHLRSTEDIGEVTYTTHVARILQDNCQSCHRPGQVAPFSLTNYEEAKTWATEINAYAQARLMPPWKPTAGFGEFQQERHLSDEQLQLLDRWVKAGTPEGEAADLPPSPEFSDEWALGEPDHVLEMAEEYVIGPEGEDDYRHFIIPTDFDGPRFVQATDVIPGNRQTVHHVIAYVDTSGKARELDAAAPGPGYTRFGDVGFEPVSALGGWAPGFAPLKTPTGTGFWLPQGADVVLQVHYYRTGVEEKDRTKVGLYFCKHPRPAPIRMGVAINNKFIIPPGEKRHRVNATWNVKEPIYAISVTPHMHLLGKEMKVTAHLPDGEVEPLVWVKDWDFNWQSAYHYRQPLFLPQGTKVKLVSYFDNSSENPNNPHDPPQPVRWGEKTTDEMCLTFVGYLRAKEWQPAK